MYYINYLSSSAKAEDLGQDGRKADIEYFRAKWIPVRMRKMREFNMIERFVASMKYGNALEQLQQKCVPVLRQELRENKEIEHIR